MTRYVSLGSLVVSAIFLCWNIYFGHLGAYGLAPEAIPQFYAVSAVIAAMASGGTGQISSGWYRAGRTR